LDFVVYVNRNIPSCTDMEHGYEVQTIISWH